MSEFNEKFQRLREEKDFDALIELIPYAHLIGMQWTEGPDGDLLFELPYRATNIGNTLLPALHGGLIGGFLENAGILYLMWHHESQETPKIVDFSLDYLRSGKAQTLYAQCEITKLGRRVAHVVLSAWQEDRSKPVAVARAHFLLT